MKKINYSETGSFTKQQETLCKEISERIAKLRKSGCSVIAKTTSLEVYKTNELRYSNSLNYGKSYSYEYPIPYLNAGCINDSGADDTEYFIDEALNLED